MTTSIFSPGQIYFKFSFYPLSPTVLRAGRKRREGISRQLLASILIFDKSALAFHARFRLPADTLLLRSRGEDTRRSNCGIRISFRGETTLSLFHFFFSPSPSRQYRVGKRGSDAMRDDVSA